MSMRKINPIWLIKSAAMTSRSRQMVDSSFTLEFRKRNWFRHVPIEPSVWPDWLLLKDPDLRTKFFSSLTLRSKKLQKLWLKLMQSGHKLTPSVNLGVYRIPMCTNDASNLYICTLSYMPHLHMVCTIEFTYNFTDTFFIYPGQREFDKQEGRHLLHSLRRHLLGTKSWSNLKVSDMKKDGVRLGLTWVFGLPIKTF